MKQQMLEAEVKELKARIEALTAELEAAKEAYDDIDQYARRHCAEVEALTAERDALKVQNEYDAAAIREEALSEAISHARQALVDAAYKYGGINVSKSSAMFTAKIHVTVALYRLMNNPRKELMTDPAQIPPAVHDIGPGDQAAAGAADYAALRQDIRNMVELYEIYGEEVSLAVDLESARGALSYLDTYEGENWPSPRILVENNSIVLAWEIGNWKLYQYCDDEPQKIFRWVGTSALAQKGNSHE